MRRFLYFLNTVSCDGNQKMPGTFFAHSRLLVPGPSFVILTTGNSGVPSWFWNALLLKIGIWQWQGALESRVREKRWKILSSQYFLQIVLLWILVLKFILITLSVAICEICSQEDGDEGTLSKHHEVEFREKWWQGNNALDYPQCKAEKEEYQSRNASHFFHTCCSRINMIIIWHIACYPKITNTIWG